MTSREEESVGYGVSALGFQPTACASRSIRSGEASPSCVSIALDFPH